MLHHVTGHCCKGSDSAGRRDTASAQPTPDPNTVVQKADQIEIDEEMEDAVVAEEQNGMYNNNISAQLM